MKFSSIIPSLYIPTSITISMAIIALTPPPTSKNFAMLSWHINMQQTKITTHMIRWYHLTWPYLTPYFCTEIPYKITPCHKVCHFWFSLSQVFRGHYNIELQCAYYWCKVDWKNGARVKDLFMDGTKLAVKNISSHWFKSILKCEIYQTRYFNFKKCRYHNFETNLV